MFNLQVTSILPTTFGVKWPIGSGVQNRFSNWRPRRPSWISVRNDFSIFFYLYVVPILPTKFRVDWPRGVGGDISLAKLLTTHDGRWLIAIAHHEHIVLSGKCSGVDNNTVLDREFWSKTSLTKTAFGSSKDSISIKQKISRGHYCSNLCKCNPRSN